MIQMIFQRILVCTGFFFSVLFSAAQKNISIKASVDKNKILIGEPIRLTIEEQISGKAAIISFQIDSLAHFEFLEKPQIDTIKTSNGSTIKAAYKITSFDSGHWVIPPFALSKKIKTDPLPVDVVFSDFDPRQDYHDIKDVIEVSPEREKNGWVYIAAGIILLTTLLFFFLKKKKKPFVQPVITIDPYKEAMQNLEQIKKKNISGKEYYSALVDIFRLYIFRKKGIQSLQKTTDDLVAQLRNLNFAREEFDQLSNALQLSDFVKFAKYIPASEDNRSVFETIKKSIQIIDQKN